MKKGTKERKKEANEQNNYIISTATIYRFCVCVCVRVCVCVCGHLNLKPRLHRPVIEK